MTAPLKFDIRILETENNLKGDLFGRLMGDLFVALGYDYPRLSIHKSGREVDLDADHRVENRRVVAECKATKAPVGGRDINEFVGVLDAEIRSNANTAGYFISLSGFKETAAEQEKNGRNTPIVLLDGDQVIEEMIRGRAMIPWADAASLAGQCCKVGEYMELDPRGELLAHRRGWIWAVYYIEGKHRTSFVLVHSDGTPLSLPVAEEIIEADRKCKGSLDLLTCLNLPPESGGLSDSEVHSIYANFLIEECGFIQLDGLPADGDVGSRRMRLENLFVPINLDIPKSDREVVRTSIGQSILAHPRLAILAPPGGGKSTLLKRIAVAYVDRIRRGEVSDDLPDRDWLPLFFRCRELRHLARGSFASLVHALSEREGVRSCSAAFRAYVDRALLGGRVLLLVDGLDEISDSGDRAAFVSTLRSAMQAYPEMAVVVTSREAGYRHVASHLVSICTKTTLSSFDEDDVHRLCKSWHREVVGDSERIESDAESLADAIVQNNRIHQLASNPLLLTTLLLVKRWLGTLPSKRAVLYGKAVEVLLMTWNTEGHAPIPEEEALPQLCFVAYAMMLEGVQKISRPKLADKLREARASMPAELGYVEGSVEDFIHRVEDRSSLLMMTGHDVEDGQLVEFFEFRHLTFQEFLTAKAVVEAWYPGGHQGGMLADVLAPHFEDEKWFEIIPLAAVLGGRDTDVLIKDLTSLVNSTLTPRSALDRTRPKTRTAGDNCLYNLAVCLADEAPATRQTIRAALREIARSWYSIDMVGDNIAIGKYGKDLLEVSGDLFFSSSDNLSNAGGALAASLHANLGVFRSGLEHDEIEDLLRDMVKSPQTRDRCSGALALMSFYFESRSLHSQFPMAHETRACLVEMLGSMDDRELYSSAWALAWLGENRYSIMYPGDVFYERLSNLGWFHPNPELNRIAQWALAAHPVVSRDRINSPLAMDRSRLSHILERSTASDAKAKSAALVLAWYSGGFLSDEDIIEVLVSMKEDADKSFIGRSSYSDLCDHLGVPFSSKYLDDPGGY